MTVRSMRLDFAAGSFDPADRETGQGCRSSYFQLFLDVRTVRFDRLDTNTQLVRDFARSHGLADQLEDFEFPIRKHLDALAVVALLLPVNHFL